VNQTRLRELLEAIQNRSVKIDDALTALIELPFADLGYAVVDHHRTLRQGVPEVILGMGKTAEQIAGIASELIRKEQNVLITRVDADQAKYLTDRFEQLRYVPLARVATIELQSPVAIEGRPVAIVSAGTADLPVAEECAETLRMFGVPFERVYDVGVAGIHRLLARRAMLEQMSVAIVVAGMEGALPSVVGGLVSIPVIAVPTSVGYGVGGGGFAALSGMLSSCASGVTVCNIDNGFGAAFAALRILRTAQPLSETMIDD
jgi:pyridinium-3,5-biscarboxylic acid mononucleotide synthase